MLNEDYREMLRVLSEERVEFLLVGAYAMAAHGYLRATLDIDLWVEPSPHNAAAVLRALQRFGAPLRDLTKSDLEVHGTVFQIGVAPRRVDIVTSVSGLEFPEARRRSLAVDIEGLSIRVLSLDDLILNKRASGRTKDLSDAEELEAVRQEGLSHRRGSESTS